MAKGAAKPHIAEFQVLEALHQEAELMRPVTISSRPVTKRVAHPQYTPQPADDGPADNSQDRLIALSDEPLVMTRISDLYEEAEAERLLADEAYSIKAPLTDAGNAETAPLDTPAELSDEFAIPAAFDAPLTAPQAEAITADDDVAMMEDEGLASAHAFDEAPLDAADIPELAAEDKPLPDIGDMPAAPVEAATDAAPDEEALIAALADDEEQTESTDRTDGADGAESINEESMADEALALDDEISKQLDDVRQAVEAASATLSAADEMSAPNRPADDDETLSPLEEEETAPHLDEAVVTDNMAAPLVAGPQLASFIGETVRDVLEEELPSLVRGLVDEALSERHGRYGGSAPIGLRTKSTRH